MKSRLTIVALISIGIVSLSAVAQTPDAPANAPELRTRCTTVGVVSTTPALPYRLFADYLQRQADYQASNLLLVEDAGAADAVIRLLAGEAGKTTIVVTNRLTGERSGNNSEWTGYPGMVAKDALQDLEAACPGSVREAPPACVAPESHASTSLVYAPPRTFSACSHTSWVDNRQLYAALQANADLKAMGVELRPACSPADAALEVMHNLYETEDWTWQVKSRIGEVVTSGQVVAFQGKDVGEKITRAALSQVAITSGVAPRMIDAVASQQAPRLAPRTLPVKWLPYDFNQHDTQLTLHLDAERVQARDRQGHVVFDFPIRQLRDARLTREWEQPFQLDYPEALIGSAINASYHLGTREPAIIKGREMPFNYTTLFTAESAGIISYFTIDAVLSQVRIPWHSLELAWNKDGVIKTVALEVPGRGSRQLVRDLLNAAAAAQQQPCATRMTEVAYAK